MSNFTLNVLVIEDDATLIAKARTAYEESFKTLNNRAGLGVEVNVFPKNSVHAEYISQLVRSSEDAEEFQNDTLVYNYIKTYLDKHKINVILLDFIITKDDEDKMSTNNPLKGTTGEKLLSSIRKSKYNHIPLLGYTQLKEEVQRLKIEERGTLFQIDKNNFTSNYFSENQGHLHTMIAEARTYQKKIENQCDVVVVCALKKEIKPVLSLLEDKIEENETFGIGYLKDKNNQKLKVMAITKQQMGMAEAATLTTQMIEKYKPRFVVMTGIAAGIDSGQNFLDVLIPTHVFNWQAGKYKIIKNGNVKEGDLSHVFDRNYNSIDIYIKNNKINIREAELKKISKCFLKSEGFSLEVDENIETKIIEYMKSILEIVSRSEFQKELVNLEIQKIVESEKINRELDQEYRMKLEEKITISKDSPSFSKIKVIYERLECQVYNDGIVSGSAVVADGELVNTTIKSRGVSGIDMEAYGVAHACSSLGINSVIIKSICDFANDEKNDIYQSAAAYVSAQVFYKLFTEYIDVESNL